MPNQALNLDCATRLVAAILEEGRALALQPLTAAVLDAGSHLVAFAREDEASTLRPQIAIGKAAGALALGVSSRRIAEMAVERPGFIAALSSLAPLGLIPAAGGVLIRSTTGQVVGAVGVTGDTSDNDERCALHALAALGLQGA
jgi:uncharacterized protein GlcG (DUF336 family)